MSERWKPEKGGKYWLIDGDASVLAQKWSDDSYDRSFHSAGNCFRTRKEATNAAKKVKTLMLSLHEDTRVNTQDAPLPKLTTEVFNRPDCPECAKYAAVDHNGIASYYDKKPYVDRSCFRFSSGKRWVLSGSFDASNWRNSLIERPAKLQKLTAEVFDLPDCPKWAKWAAVNEDGYAYYYPDTPFLVGKFNWTVEGDVWQAIYCKFDPSDWKNSRIERPVVMQKLTTEVFDRPDCPEWARYAFVNGFGTCVLVDSVPGNARDGGVTATGCDMKRPMEDWGLFENVPGEYIERPNVLPEWCKVGEWGYYIPITEYCKIEQIDGSFTLRFADGGSTTIPLKDVHNLAQARLRPYYGLTVDGKSCGVFEHLEDGEWVK